MDDKTEHAGRHERMRRQENVTGESQRADQVDDAKVPGAKGQCRLICRHRNGARGRWS